MSTIEPTVPVSKGRLWVGRIISVLPALFLLLDAIGKLVKPKQVVDATVQLGYNENVIVPLGIVLLICTVLYLIPRTAVLGAILLTGYLGGAVATHVRAGESLFSIVFPVIFGILLWLGLYLRDPWLGKLVPIHQ
ncbi:MAG TPA: DoxX family protein [Pyrinomonadaceae bacterium]|nr:DoxX family protein [Pyrinomonadaceae bacterium]